VSRLGFLGWPLFARESARQRLLEKLGLAWILSFETRLINGLRGIDGRELFAGPRLWRSKRKGRERAIEAMREDGIVHEDSLTLFSISCKQLSRAGEKQAERRTGESIAERLPAIRPGERARLDRIRARRVSCHARASGAGFEEARRGAVKSDTGSPRSCRAAKA